MEQPLVSIVVITYNSAKTVIETLDSAKNQTYKNIELIVSDDCSTDNTVEICREWISENKDRFVRTELLTVEKNTGVSANCNRGYKETRGKWIKGLAGDDIFLPNCIKDNIDFINNNPDVKILFSFAQCFSIVSGKYVEREVIPYISKLSFFNKSPSEQLIQLYAKNDIIPAPTLFIDARLAKENPYSDKFKNLEDYPQWINFTQNGFQLYFMNKTTIAYRIGESVSRSLKRLYNISFKETVYSFQDSIRNEQLKYHPKLVKEQDFERKLFYFFTTHLKNRRNLFTLLLRLVLIRSYRLWLDIVMK